VAYTEYTNTLHADAHNYVHQKNLEVPQMIEDSIIEEIHFYRKKHAEKFLMIIK